MGYRKLEVRKKGMTLYIILLVAALALMLFMKECSTKRIGERVDAAAGGDTLNVAIEISPKGLSLAGDTLSGVYYDMIREMCRRNNRSVKFHPYTRLEDAIEWLNSGRCRLIVGDLPITAEMRDNLIFVDPVGVDRQVLVQLSDSASVKTQFDLGGKRVYVARESPYIQRLRNLSHEIGDTIYIVEDTEYSSEQLVILTAVGEIPRAVVNRAIAESLGSRYPDLDLSVDISFNQFQSWALARGDTLLRDTLNQQLREMAVR